MRGQVQAYVKPPLHARVFVTGQKVLACRLSRECSIANEEHSPGESEFDSGWGVFDGSNGTPVVKKLGATLTYPYALAAKFNLTAKSPGLSQLLGQQPPQPPTYSAMVILGVNHVGNGGRHTCSDKTGGQRGVEEYLHDQK